MLRISRWVIAFLFPAVRDTWLTFLRVGIGVEVTLYSLSLRHDWNNLLRANGKGIISRDLSEAILNVQSSLVPRVDWLISLGSRFGLSEDVALSAIWILLLSSACLLLLGLLSRVAAVTAWFLHLCAVNSESLMTYGMDYFTTIGLFYLMIAPLPDRYALGYRIWTRRPKDPHLLGFFQRVLQLHLCLVYFFSGLAKSLGVDWWNGTSVWRSLTCPPYNVLSSDTLLHFTWLLPLVGISVCVLELGYPFFIWPERTRPVWLVGILAMHVTTAFTMGLYLFSLIMVVLNLAAFGVQFLQNYAHVEESY